MRKIFFIAFIAVCCHTNSWAQRTTTESETISLTKKSSNCRPQHAFGLDFGLGSMSTSTPNERDNRYYDYRYRDEYGDEAAFTFAVGFRYLYHFSPYFGVDFFKFNHKLSINLDSEYFAYNPQMMMGVRGNSPSFAGCMSAYAAFRLGYGVAFEWYDPTISDSDYYTDHSHDDDRDYFGYGICGELEVGLNINRFFFVAYSYNYQGGKRRLDNNDYNYRYNYSDLVMHYHAIRFGFNFGR